MTYDIIADFACHCGEGPLFHPPTGRVYFSDIPTGRLFHYDPVTDTARQFYDGRPVGGYTIQHDGKLLLFRDRGNVVTADPETGDTLDTVIDELPDEVGTRFNDVIADPAGRVFCGTMPVGEGKPTGPRKGRLYRLDPDGSIHLLLEDIGCSNGMAFILDNQGQPVGMYYIDTPTGNVYRFDYNIDTGAITNQTIHVHISKDSGLGGPDGMTVDDRGHLYVALWGGWGVARYDAQGKFITKYELPARNVTSCIFAPTPGSVPALGSTPGSAPGSDAASLDRLYVTSAMAQQKPESGEHAGATFRIDVEANGLEDYRSRIGT